MSRQIATTLDASPPVSRWMKGSLVKDAFRKTIPVLAARMAPTRTGLVLKAEAMKGCSHTLNLRV